MSLLTDNPIANLHGPAFLMFFAVVIAASCGWTWWRVQAADPTRLLPVPALPQKLDPLEIAYLRGGAEEQVRLIILDLVARGYLVQTSAETAKGHLQPAVEHAPKHPDVAHLDSLSRYVFDWIDNPKRAVQFFPALPAAILKKKTAANLAGALEVRGMVTSEEQQKATRQFCVPAQWLIFLLGAYKLVIALMRGRYNVLFLIVLTIAGIYLVQRFCRPRRLTDLGRRYLARIQQALDGLKSRVPALATNSGNDHFILAVAAFGIGTLASTAYGFYPEMFPHASRNPARGCGTVAACGVAAPAVSSGSSGSSCGSGSSCSSGSSCGSSCGGGCGGGCGGCGS